MRQHENRQGKWEGLFSSVFQFPVEASKQAAGVIESEKHAADTEIRTDNTVMCPLLHSILLKVELRKQVFAQGS